MEVETLYRRVLKAEKNRRRSFEEWVRSAALSEEEIAAETGVADKAVIREVRKRIVERKKAARRELKAFKDRVFNPDQLVEQLKAVKQESDQLKEELAKYEKPSKGMRVGKWTVHKSGGYYRAFRKKNGRMFGVYLGKKLDRKAARDKIKAKIKEKGWNIELD